jgi:hypothetical protein
MRLQTAWNYNMHWISKKCTQRCLLKSKGKLNMIMILFASIILEIVAE